MPCANSLSVKRERESCQGNVQTSVRDRQNSRSLDSVKKKKSLKSSLVAVTPAPSGWAWFLARAVLAVDRRLLLSWMKFTGQYPKRRGWSWTDGFYTPHNTDFRIEASFEASYRYAVHAVGSDFRIPWRVHQAIWAARSAPIQDGKIVELGTGKGFIMSALLHNLEMNKVPRGEALLFDFFAKPAESGFGREGFAAVYAENSEEVRSRFSQFDELRLVEGDVRSTVPACLKDLAVAFLHLDLNEPRIETEMLSQVWDQLLPGGIVLLDDYANDGMEESYEGMNSLARRIGFSILTTAAGQGIIVKAQ